MKYYVETLTIVPILYQNILVYIKILLTIKWSVVFKLVNIYFLVSRICAKKKIKLLYTLSNYLSYFYMQQL